MSLIGLRRSVGLVAFVLLLGLATAGCGAAGQANPEKIGPRGVDELVIPTPHPDPGDFVDAVTNPWLPLTPGTVWTYAVAGSAIDEVEVRVEDGRETVAGVECVVVRTMLIDPAAQVVGVSRFFAQDRAGNVWLFGERSDVEGAASRSWMAGEDGAEAGIAMLATPRVGDGYLHQQAPTADDRSTVLALDEERTVPAGTFGGLLLTEDSSTLEPVERVVYRYYAEGTGLVEETTTTGGTQRLVLRSVVVPPTAG